MNGLYDGEFAGYKIASSDELNTALRDAVVAIDANVLLDLYRFRHQTSKDLIKTFKSLENRLVVPHQALREFWRHRQRAQGSPRGATKTATDALSKSAQAMSNALTTWAKAVGVDDDELSALTGRVDGFLGSLRETVQELLHDADAERAGDSILEQLEELLAGKVTQPLTSEEHAECVAEANLRIENEQPPGHAVRTTAGPRPHPRHPRREGRLVVATAVRVHRATPRAGAGVLRAEWASAVSHETS